MDPLENCDLAHIATQVESAGGPKIRLSPRPDSAGPGVNRGRRRAQAAASAFFCRPPANSLPSTGEDTASRTAMVMCVPAAMGRKGPLSDRASVYVDELSLGVIAYAARAEGERRVSQPRCWNARNPDVERIRLNMLRVLCCVRGSALAERIIGLLRPVAAKNLDYAARVIQLPEHGVKDIEGAGIVALDLVIVAVAQKLAEIGESFRNIGVADSVDDVNDLAILLRQFELVFLAILRHFVVVGNGTDARQVNGRQHVTDSMEMRMPMALKCACAGIRTGSHEHHNGCESENLTGRNKATNQ